jgi:tetratricopeptide (TPR) repeat protein
MKNYSLHYITIVSVFSFNCFAQIANNVSLNIKKIGGSATNTPVITEKSYSGKKVKYYHVVEIINMQFGGYTTTYDVTDAKLIRTNDLGPNNIRIVTPKFTDGEQLADLKLKKATPKFTDRKQLDGLKLKKATPKFTDPKQLDDLELKIITPKSADRKQLEAIKLRADTLKAIGKPSDFKISETPKKKEVNAYIDIIKTYERISEKGYKSIDMLKKIGNAYFFNDELDKAAKIYTELFKMSSDLEPEYYYRFSLSLKSIGENNKANQMLKKFNELPKNTTRE